MVDEAHEQLAAMSGAGGIFVQTEEPLPTDSTIKLSFKLPGGTLRHAFEGRVDLPSA